MARPRIFSSAPAAAPPLQQQQSSLLPKLQLPLLAAATLLLFAPTPSLGLNLLLPLFTPKGPPPPAPPPIPNPACPRCTFLSDRFGVTMSNNWGYPKAWPCRMSTLRPVGAPDNGTYNMRCPLPPRLVAESRAWSSPSGVCHLTCPTEPNCSGRQCFGNLYLAANRYDAYINTVMRCTANPIACVAKQPVIAAYLGVSRRPNGKFMDPKTESSEPPFTKKNPLRPIAPSAPSGGSTCRMVNGAIVCGV